MRQPVVFRRTSHCGRGSTPSDEIPLSRSIRDVRTLGVGFAAISRLVGSGYDIVHVHTPIAGFLTRAAIHRLPVATRPAAVYTAHGFHFHANGHSATNALFLTAERMAGRWTDRLVVINEEDAAAAAKHHIVPPRRLVHMPGIGVDTARFSRAALDSGASEATRVGLGISTETPVFVAVGELNRNKRPMDILGALARMRDRTAHLIFLGVGPEDVRIAAAAQELGLGDRVHLVGMVDDVRPYLASSTALILASKREGLPRSIMEALSMEVPVITSSSRGSPQLVGGDAGLVVPIGDLGAIAHAMDRFVDAPDDARLMGERGRFRMVNEYSFDRLVAHHEGMYRNLLHPTRRVTT